MLRKLHTLARSSLLTILFLAVASAQNHFIVRAPSGNIKDICSKHGLQLVAALGGSANGLYIVNSPQSLAQVQQLLRFESAVQRVEQDQPLALPEASKGSSVLRTLQSVSAMVTSLQQAGFQNSDDGAGNSVWKAYTSQPMLGYVKANQLKNSIQGAGTVALLDTGIDFLHPALKNSVVWGYDFINKVPGGFATPIDLNQSTTSILDQSTTSILDQSTTSILDANSVVVLDQSTTSILDQSTTSILDQSTTSILDASKPINDYGHGTMVAGIIHLIAPKAKLLPVKVFDVHGGSSISLLIAGIHYAVDNGAKVINMSFSMTAPSQELTDAILYATSQGLIVVAAAGNEGKSMLVYPAACTGVIGVGATEDNKVRAAYSNFGPVVDVSAPGSAIVTTYPNNRYAAGWGTSFSAPAVAGAASLLLQLDSHLNWQTATQAVEHAQPLPGQQLGAGLLDLTMATSGVR